MTEYSLSSGCIRDIFALELNNNNSVSLLLQILNIRLTDKKEDKVLYTCKLSDSFNTYQGFVLIKQNNVAECEEKDIIRITNITHHVLRGNHVFLIKNYEIVRKCADLIGNPMMYIYSEGDEKQSLSIKQELKDNRDEQFIPLKYLTNYSENFKILVKVIKKLEKRTFQSKHIKDGKFFNFYVVDKEGTNFPVSCFNDSADVFFNKIYEGGIYKIYGANIKLNNKAKSPIKTEYRLFLDENSAVEEIFDDSFPESDNFLFIKLKELLNTPLNSYVDVIGVCVDQGEVQFVKNNDFKKIKIVDNSEYKVEIALWGEYAKSSFKISQVIAFKYLKLIDFNKKFLSLTSGYDTKIIIDPVIKEKDELEKFFKENENFEYKYLAFDSNQKAEINENSSKMFENFILPNITKFSMICEVRDLLESIGEYNKSLPIFKLKCYIKGFKNSLKNIYNGCVSCRKKLLENDNNYLCATCGRIYETPNYFYRFTAKIQDFTGEYYINVIGESGDVILNISAEKYLDMILQNDQTGLKNILFNMEKEEFVVIVKPKLLKNIDGAILKNLNAYSIEKLDKNKEIQRLSSIVKQFISN